VRVEVLYFGVLREVFGAEKTTVALEDGADVGALLSVLRGVSSNQAAADSPGKLWTTLAVAVNREYAGLGTMLNDGDEVALLPPVSGGLHAG
jgi:molybdopterin converting factor small subunit